jgi:hypothetical protein
MIHPALNTIDKKLIRPIHCRKIDGSELPEATLN